MKAWIKQNKKILLVSLGLLLCICCIFFINHMKATAGLMGTETPGNYLFHKYPIENYMLDSYVDTAGNWLPWNWGKALNDGAYSLLTFIVGCMYIAIFKFFHIVGYLIEAVYSTDVVSVLMDVVVDFVQNISGFDGTMQADGLFPQFLAIMVILTGVYYGFQAIKKETGKTINGILTFLLLIIVSLGFFYKADYFVGKANEIAVGVQSVVIRAGTNALGMSDDPAVSIREGFFDITVYQPYLLLQYNDNTVSMEKADAILRLESGSEAREALVKQEVENGNKMMNGIFGLQLRLSNMLPLILSSVVLAVVILAIVCLNIYHQLAFLLYVCFSPFALIISLIPGKSQVAVRLGGKIFYELCMRTALAMLLCLMYGFSSAVFTVTGLEGYIVGALLQSILYIAIFLFRKKIYEFFLTNSPVKKSGGFRSMVGTAFMINRAYRMFGGGKQKPKAKEAQSGKGGFIPASFRGGYQRPVPGIGMNQGTSQNENSSSPSGGGGDYTKRDKNVYTGTKPKGQQQPANAGTVQRKKKPGMNRNTAENIKYYAGSSGRTGRNTTGKGDMEYQKRKRSGSVPGSVGKSGTNRNGAGWADISGIDNRRRYNTNIGKYRVARKDSVPRVRQTDWGQQAHQTPQTLPKRKMNENDNNSRKNYVVRDKRGYSQSLRMNENGTKNSSGNSQSGKNASMSNGNSQSQKDFGVNTENRPYRKNMGNSIKNGQSKKNSGNGGKRLPQKAGIRAEQQKTNAGNNPYRGKDDTSYTLAVRKKGNLGKQEIDTKSSEKE